MWVGLDNMLVKDTKKWWKTFVRILYTVVGVPSYMFTPLSPNLFNLLTEFKCLDNPLHVTSLVLSHPIRHPYLVGTLERPNFVVQIKSEYKVGAHKTWWEGRILLWWTLCVGGSCVTVSFSFYRLCVCPRMEKLHFRHVKY